MYKLNITIVLICTLLGVALANPILPNGVLNYMPITVTNNQNVSSSSSFQQMLVINSNNYAFYESSNLHNIEFFYANGTIIPSWLESGKSSASASTIYWLRLTPIPASSNITVYMGFGSQTQNFFNKITTGESPNPSPLGGNYSTYDTGFKVFNFYDNFAGTSLNTSKWGVGYAGISSKSIGTYIVNDGLTTLTSFVATNTSTTHRSVYELGTAINITSNAKFGYPAYFEWYMDPFPPSTNYTIAIGPELSMSYGADGGIFNFGKSETLGLGRFGFEYLWYPNSSSSSSGVLNRINNSLGTGSHLYSIRANTTYVNDYFDYKLINSQKTAQIINKTAFGAVLNYETNLPTPKMYWIRIRSYLPNGVMPAVKVGSMQGAQTIQGKLLADTGSSQSPLLTDVKPLYFVMLWVFTNLVQLLYYIINVILKV